MATLVLTVAATADDARVSDLGYDDSETSMNVGGTGSAAAGHGQGWRFTGVTLTASDTVTRAVLSLMKNATQFSTRDMRLVVEDADNAGAFASGSPNRPGDRAIVSGTIPAEAPNTNEIDGTRYDIPSTTTLQDQLGALIETLLARGGWASGNALVIVNNSDQDASANTGFGRKTFHTWDSATGSSEPTLTITYTVAGAPTPIVCTEITGAVIASTSNATTYASASYTPVANLLYLLAVVHSDAAAEATVPTVATTNGLAFVRIGSSVVFDTIASNVHRITLFRAMKSSGLSAGTHTVTFGDASTGCAAMLVEVTGMKTTGTDGADAVTNNVTNNANATTNPSVTFGAFSNTYNGAIMFVGSDIQTAPTNDSSGWTSLSNPDYATPGTGLYGQWRADNDTSGTVTLASSDWGAIGVELVIKVSSMTTPPDCCFRSFLRHRRPARARRIS